MTIPAGRLLIGSQALGRFALLSGADDETDAQA